MSRPILFVDRDGTLIDEPMPSMQVDSFEKLKFLPEVIRYLYRIQHELGFDLVMVTNQDGLGTDSFPEDSFLGVQNLLISIFNSEGITFREILIDTSFEEEKKPTRKPGIELARHYLLYPALDKSFMVGDRKTDIEFAKNLGIKSIAIGKEIDSADYQVTSWKEIYNYLARLDRAISRKRVTNETDIEVKLNLDGQARFKISSGLGFLDHMLEQLAKHSGMDLEINCSGDLHIDEHHTVEDIAITLGEALKLALFDKRGIERYGFCLPMDESRAEVLIDLSGRAYLVWQVEFLSNKVGDVTSDLFKHFFRSLADAASINIHITAKAENDHHLIESVFKSFARALRQAIKRDHYSGSAPTTKGKL